MRTLIQNDLSIVDHRQCDDEEKWIGYKSISEDIPQSVLQLGARFTIATVDENLFDDLMTEMMRNDHYSMTEHQWNAILPISRALESSEKAQTMRLTIGEIQALKILLDFPELRQCVMQCHHEEDQEKRLDFQRTFYNFNSRINSAISKSRDEIKGRLYLRILPDDDNLNLLTMYTVTCCGPTLFYTDLETANSMGTENVTILVLYPPFDRLGLDISWLCSYTNGPRILLSNITLQIANIHHPSVPIIDFNQYAVNDQFSINDLIKTENDLLFAIRNMKWDDNVDTLSLNKQNRIGLFSDLSEKEMWSVLTVLSIQYRPEIWEQIQQILSDDLEHQGMQIRLRAMMYLRDHMINLVNEVRSVAMVDLPRSLKMFFFTPNMQHVDCDIVDLSKILQLFPMTNQVTISGDDFDWTLQEFAEFAKDHDLESEHVSLRHVRLAVVERVALNRLNEHDSRENLKVMRMRGWKMVTPIHFYYFGSMPEPQTPFSPMFIASAPGDDSGMEHNDFSCTLSVDLFVQSKHQQELTHLLSQRKMQMSGDMAGEDHQKSLITDEFGYRCDLVESLVLDPLPFELRHIFRDEDGNLSIDIVLMIFPNVTDLYFRSTTFEIAECLRFIEFIKNQSNPMNLQNIHFSITNRMNPENLPKIEGRLKEVGWRFESSRQILTKKAHQKWQCTECGHWNRSMMIGGEYKHPQPVGTECALCVVVGEDMNEKDGDLEEKDDSVIIPMQNEISHGIDISMEFAIIGKSPCRKLEYLGCGQFVYVLDQHVFESIPANHMEILTEHKARILQYFRENSVDGDRYKEERAAIARALSDECCGTDKLIDVITEGLFNTMDNIDWTQWNGDAIPGIEWLPHCAAMDRIKCVLKHYEQSLADSQCTESMSDFVMRLDEECQYTLYDIKRDLEHIFENHRNFAQMAVKDTCNALEQCIHCRRNKQFRGGVGTISENIQYFGSNDIGAVTRIMILDRLHCVIKHYLMPKTLRDREWTFNLLLRNIRNATFLQYAHGMPIEYSSMTPKYRNLISELLQNQICPLSKEVVDEYIVKANDMMNDEVVMGWKAKRFILQNGIKRGDGMFIEFLICLLIYCSESAFCRAFRASVRSLKLNYNDNMIRQNHTANFYWFGRYLECALIHYGRNATSAVAQDVVDIAALSMLFPNLENYIDDNADEVK